MNSTELISNFDSKELLQNSFTKVQELLFEVTLVVMKSVIGEYVKTIETLPPWLKVGAIPCGTKGYCSPRKF